MNYLVYRFLDKNNKTIYVGKTNDLEERMSQHRLKKKDLWSEYYRIEYINFDNVDDQKFYEILAINIYKPKYNISTKYNVTFHIDDPKKQEWNVYDEIRIFTKDELLGLYNCRTKQGRRSLQYYFRSKWFDARDEEEEYIRDKNYHNYLNLYYELDREGNNEDDSNRTLKISGTNWEEEFTVTETKENGDVASLIIGRYGKNIKISTGLYSPIVTKEEFENIINKLVNKFNVKITE